MYKKYKNLKHPLKTNSYTRKKERIENICNEIQGFDENKLKAMSITSDIFKNVTIVKSLFKNCSDFISNQFNIDAYNLKAEGAYIKGLVDSNVINNIIEKSLKIDSHIVNEERKLHSNDITERLKESIIYNSSIEEINNFDDVIKKILSGYYILFLENNSVALAIECTSYQKRSISEPITETSLRGPFEAFIEDIETNLSLVRKKLKTHRLKTEVLELGRLSNTSVALLYLDGIANESLINEVKKRLKKIDIDVILESGHIEQLIEDSPFSPFPTMAFSEKPDYCALNLSYGKIVVLVDGTPFALVLPAVFMDFLSTSEDSYVKTYYAVFLKCLRVFSFFLALLGTSIYIGIVTYHQELIPTSLLVSIAASHATVPFPTLLEALLMESTFEILREAGERLPTIAGEALSIIGALVIGQTAIDAGLVSHAMIIVVALSAIASFTLPRLVFSRSVRIIRYGLMFLAGVLGLFGVIMGVLVLLIHLASLRSIGVPYLSPISPSKLNDWKTSFLNFPMWSKHKRPSYLEPINERKIAKSSRPRPPK